MSQMTAARSGEEARVRRLSVEEVDDTCRAVGMPTDMGAIHLFQVLFNSPVIGATINTAKDRILKETDLDPRLLATAGGGHL